jgi:GNAT superfamily N-acetyltransferase
MMTDVSTGVMMRAARDEDLQGILNVADAARRRYATYQPVFWRPAADARARQESYLAALLRDPDVLAYVGLTDGAVVGFAIARLLSAPPVYDPGGVTCLLDDFAVADQELWPSLGLDLLHAVRDAARARGAVQLVVITGAQDVSKRAALAAAGLRSTSEWWTGPVDAAP